jgi:hypothetical protein
MGRASGFGGSRSIRHPQQGSIGMLKFTKPAQHQTPTAACRPCRAHPPPIRSIAYLA